MGPIFLTPKASTPRAWNTFATTWPQNKEDCLPRMVSWLGKPNKRSEDCGWIPKWRKGASCSWGLFLSCPDILGSCPPPLTAIFILRAGIRTLSPEGGWKDALIHQNSSIGIAFTLTTAKAASYPFSDAILVPVWETSTADGECKPQITGGVSESQMGAEICFNSLFMIELRFKPRLRQGPPFGAGVDFVWGVSAEWQKTAWICYWPHLTPFWMSGQVAQCVTGNSHLFLPPPWTCWESGQ